MTKIGIIAGDGNLPLYIGKSLLSKNYDVTFLSLNNKNNKFYNNHHVVDLDILSVKKIFKVLDSNKTSISIKNKIGLIKSKMVIAPGYICSNKKGETSNLGRGGSDYSAAIYAKYVNAKVLEIWTDVSGVFSANPKIVKKASPIEFLSYKEAMELSFFG